MENQEGNSNKGTKVIIAILVLLLCGSGYYIYKLTTDAKIAQEKEIKFVTEKTSLESKLEEQKKFYDDAIANKTTANDSLTAVLVSERDKVVSLMKDLKISKNNANGLAGFKKKYLEQESIIKTLVAQNEVLKKKNVVLTTQLDSTSTVLTDTKQHNEDLLNQNTELSKTVMKAAKLSLFGLKSVGYKVKSSGKQIETDKASSVDMIKVSFSIAENSVAKPVSKTYYIQLIDSKNNVLGDKKIKIINGKSLTYSYESVAKYQGKALNITQEILGDNFEKGVYFVNVFDQTDLVSDITFTLK